MGLQEITSSGLDSKKKWETTADGSISPFQVLTGKTKEEEPTQAQQMLFVSS
jgi:hypothetical protein